MRAGNFFIVMLVAWLSGCASMNRVEQYDYQFDGESGQLAPVRLYINREQVMGSVQGGMVNVLYREIRATGAFFGAGSFMETPWVIDIELTWSSSGDAGSFIGAMASAASLGLVPSKHDQHYRAEVGIYENGLLVDQFTVEEESTMVLSAYNYAEAVSGETHATAMKNLALRIVEQLDQAETIPRIELLSDPPEQDSIST